MPSAPTTRSASRSATTAGAPSGSPGSTEVTAAPVTMSTPQSTACRCSVACSRRRCTPISATASRTTGVSGRGRIGRPWRSQVPPAHVWWPSAATLSSSKPSPRNAATALRDMAKPAPTSASSGERFSTVTFHPVRAREIAQARDARSDDDRRLFHVELLWAAVAIPSILLRSLYDEWPPAPCRGPTLPAARSSPTRPSDCSPARRPPSPGRVSGTDHRAVGTHPICPVLDTVTCSVTRTRDGRILMFLSEPS